MAKCDSQRRAREKGGTGTESQEGVKSHLARLAFGIRRKSGDGRTKLLRKRRPCQAPGCQLVTESFERSSRYAARYINGPAGTDVRLNARYDLVIQSASDIEVTV